MRMIIYIGLVAVGGILLLIGGFGLIGSLLSVNHVTQVSAQIGAPAQKVWETLTNLDDFPSWSPGVDRIETLPEKNGHRTFRQHQGRNSFVLEETLSQPPTRLIRTIADDNKFFSGEWDIQIQDLGNGRSTLNLKENGTIPSAIPRAVLKLCFGYDYYLNKFTKALQTKLGS